MPRTRSPHAKQPPHRKVAHALSSVARRALPPLACMGLLAGALGFVHSRHEWPAEAFAATTRPQLLTPDQQNWYRNALGVQANAAAAMPAADPTAEALVRWKRLSQSGSTSFDDYAGFLEAHPGWPGEAALRRAAERAIDPNATPAGNVVAYFSRMPPTTNSGRVRYAEALRAQGRAAEARAMARTAWTSGALSADDEARLSNAFAFQPADQDTRMEALLWQRAIGPAQRQIAYTSAARRAIYTARLAFQGGGGDAQSLSDAAGPAAEQDAGFLIDKARWQLDHLQIPQARALLGAPRRLDAPPFDPQAWLTALLTFEQGAAHDGQIAQAIGIAQMAAQTYPAGVSARDRPLAERDPYTSIMWAAGQAALRGGQSRQAIDLFERYAAAAQTPGTRAKGQYWAGRAATAAGDAARAQSDFAAAAGDYDQFYGQLSAERLGRPIPLPSPPATIAIPPARQQAFDADERIRAARMLGEIGDWTDQTQFLRTIAAASTDDTDHLLIGTLSRELGRPDLGVMVARVGRQNGTSDYVQTGFPEIAVPPTAQADWTMIHAISRQESQFDRMARSRVGATGMMQLMPATAREQAGKLGLDYDPSRLTDPQYNVQLGADFYNRLMDRFSGSYVLAVAAYNAGPGNVNKFIRANGDPRLPGADVVAWIEAIPLSETRGYVQHVLENAVVYDLLNPNRSRMPTTNRLSAYLGKTQPG